MIAAVSQVHPRPPRAADQPTLREAAGLGRAAVVDILHAARFVLVSLVGLLYAISSFVVSVVVWSAMSKRGRWVRVAFVAFACFQGFTLYCDAPRAAERERLIRAVEEFHATHGRYPISLEEAGVMHDPTVFRQCSYFAESNPIAAYLELSDGFLSNHWEYDFRQSRWEKYYD